MDTNRIGGPSNRPESRRPSDLGGPGWEHGAAIGVGLRASGGREGADRGSREGPRDERGSGQEVETSGEIGTIGEIQTVKEGAWKQCAQQRSSRGTA